MKPSRFNFFFQIDDGPILAYNSLTLSLVKLSGAEYACLQEFSDHPTENFFEVNRCSSFGEELLQAGFIIPDSRDELEYARAIHLAMKRENKVMGLTIVPTLDCNFRCVYCFSYARRERMQPVVQEALLRFVEKRIPQSGGLSVTWYGGEPSLCLPIIEKLTEGFRELCRHFEAEYLPASIVTNGYLLRKKTAQRLQGSGVKTAQVTLDGSREVHNQRRPLKNGMGTFDRILDNIEAAKQILQIQIRINIDTNNIGTVVELLDQLVERGLQDVPISFGHVQPFTQACAGIVQDCLSDEEFGQAQLALTRQALARGLLSIHYPRLHLGGVCGSDQESSYLVAPDGLLFKCWAQASLGQAHSIGSLFQDEPSPTQVENLKRFLEWDAWADENCRECRVLPICMGGCPYIRMNGTKGSTCFPWRYFLLDTLALRYKLSQLNQAQVSETQAV